MIDNPDYPPIERPKKKEHPPEKPPKGLLDHALRAGKSVTHALLMLPIYLIASVVVGTAIAPGIGVFRLLSSLGENAGPVAKTLATGIGIGAGFFTYGFAILFVVPLVNWPLKRFVKPNRGSFYSAQFLPWYLHNSLAYIVRYSFLDYATPTPLNHLYYKMMGMKVGHGTQINSSNLSDPALLVLEENVTIGGSASIICHYGQSGYLILAPTIIRKGAVIGMLATIMGDVEVGEGAKVLANSLVLPKTRIPAGETWAGVPARKIEL